MGVGGVRTLEPGTAEIKRMWIDPSWRGAGLGNRLLHALEELAAELGHHRVVLDTNAVLLGAVALYERAGYDRVEPYNDNPYADCFFAKALSRG